MLTLLCKGVPTKLLKFFWLKIFLICHRCQRHRWSTLSCEYIRSYWDTLGLGGNWLMKKTRSEKSSDTVPLIFHAIHSYVRTFIYSFAEGLYLFLHWSLISRGPPWGCRTGIRTWACHTASRPTTDWDTPYLSWAALQPTELRLTLTELRRTADRILHFVINEYNMFTIYIVTHNSLFVFYSLRYL